MFRPALAVVVLLALVAAAPVPQERLAELAAGVAERYNLPAVGVRVSGPGGASQAVAGVRGRGDDAAVEAGDAWHLGSCTKAVTALLAGRLVDRGVIGWDATPADVLGDLPAAADPNTAKATLRQLLSHTSGLPGPEADGLVLPIARLREAAGQPAIEQRRGTAMAVLTLPNAGGNEWAYCNGGFILAGAMLEAAAGEPLEDLMEREVFGPLSIPTAGWGPPPAISGHFGGEPSSLDNPKAYDAAGRLHVSLADWDTLCRAALGEPAGFLEPGTLDAIRTAVSDDPPYALGWLVGESEPLGRHLHHAGTNTLWMTQAVVVPDRGLVIVIAANEANSPAVANLTGLVVDELDLEPATRPRRTD